ncbi:MAG: hypothetical protein ACR2QF_17445 [Geminicoccaceae bacterium]
MWWAYRHTGALAALALLLSTPAGAADLTMEPRFAAGISYYELELDGEIVVNNNSIDNVEFSDWLYLVGGGLTLSKDRFFMDFYGQYSFDGEDDLDLDIAAGGIVVDNLEQDVEFDRIETAITIGYRVTDQFAPFIGFRYADVDFDGSGSLGAISADFSTDFRQRGPFIGAGYVIPKTVFGGAFVANAAVAYLDGDLENKLEVSQQLADVAFDIDGTAIGFNAGASWVTPLTGQLKLVLGADVARYSFDDDDDETDFDELITRFRTELRYSFGVGGAGSQ